MRPASSSCRVSAPGHKPWGKWMTGSWRILSTRRINLATNPGSCWRFWGRLVSISVSEGCRFCLGKRIHTSVSHELDAWNWDNDFWLLQQVEGSHNSSFSHTFSACSWPVRVTTCVPSSAVSLLMWYYKSLFLLRAISLNTFIAKTSTTCHMASIPGDFLPQDMETKWNH